MANIKISNLPVAVSVAGSDSFPVVQSGVTKQATKSVLLTDLGTPASLVLTNATGLPIDAGTINTLPVARGGTGVTTSTGSGNVVLSASPTLTGTTIVSALTASGNVSFDGGTFVFNESGADKDARFEGDTDANLLFLDASTDRVGIGTNVPTAKLTIFENTLPSAFHQFSNVTGSPADDDAQQFSVWYANAAVSGLTFSPSDARLLTFTVTQNDEIAVRAGALALLSTNYCVFYAGGADRMHITSSGSVGIGTATPASGASLDVNGSIRAKQGIPDSSDLSTTGYAFGGDGDTGMFSPVVGGGGASNGVLAFYCNDTERLRMTATNASLISTVDGTAPTLSTNSTMSFELTSDTSLKIVVRGTDGTTRSVSLTLS